MYSKWPSLGSGSVLPQALPSAAQSSVPASLKRRYDVLLIPRAKEKAAASSSGFQQRPARIRYLSGGGGGGYWLYRYLRGPYPYLTGCGSTGGGCDWLVSVS